MKHIGFAHGIVMEVTNYTVITCSKSKKQSKMEIQEENTRQGKKVRNMWLMLKKKN